MFLREFVKNLGKYAINLLIAIDQLVNAILLGDADETISSRLGKNYPKLSKVVNFIFFWDKSHCQEAIEEDEGKNAIN